MNGIVLVEKPEGITSNSVVGEVKRLVKPSKVGHTGTLDPAASGLLVITIGAATRTLDFLDESPKTYKMGVILGEESDTGDKEGNIVKRCDSSGVPLSRIEEVAEVYLGVTEQAPPHYAAIKVGGEPLYKLARKGVFPEVQPRTIEIFELKIESWAPPLLNMEVVCSKGTYARAIARDIGNDLGVGGRLETLLRTKAGRYRLEDSISMDDISGKGVDIIRQSLIPIDKALDHIPEFPVTPPEMKRLVKGAAIMVTRGRFANAKIKAQKQKDFNQRLFRVASKDGSVVLLLKPAPKGSDVEMRPTRVFHDLKE